MIRYHRIQPQKISEKIDGNLLYQNVFYIFITTPLCFSKATQTRLQNSKYYIYLRNASLPLRYTIIEVAPVHLSKLCIVPGLDMYVCNIMQVLCHL